jgi:hypothetical protein
MALEGNQVALSASTLYKLTRLGTGPYNYQPRIEIIGTATAVYVADSLPSSAPTGMAVADEDFTTGVKVFTSLPRYIYITGSPTSVVLTEAQAEAV